MTSPHVSPFCCDLRSKKLLLLDRPALDPSDVLDGANHCWCFRTQKVLGPDRARVEPEACTSGRGCFRTVFERLT
jgi:hypothetical protein